MSSNEHIVGERLCHASSHVADTGGCNKLHADSRARIHTLEIQHELREIPELAAARQVDAGRCLEVVGVAEESARDDVAEVARRLPYPVVIDPRAEVAAGWGVSAYPRTFLLDREGRLARIFEGALDRAELEAAAAPLLDHGCLGARR